MGHYLFNFSDGNRAQAAALLDVKMWGIAGDERHRDELAPGDVALIYVSTVGDFIGRAELATAVNEWTPSEAPRYPGDSLSGVLLSEVEKWDPRGVDGRRPPADRSGGVESCRPGERPGWLPNGRRSDPAHEYESVLEVSGPGQAT